MQNQSISDYFKNDHERLDGLFLQFQSNQKNDLSKAKESFRDFKAGLERHILWEEEILFPFFEKVTGMIGSGPTAMMRYEHEGLREVLHSIHSKIQSNHFEVEADSALLMAALCEHNHKEETALYPVLDHMTTNKDREEIFEKMKNYPEKRFCCCEAHA